MMHAPQVSVPATYMRGGTSKGVFFRLHDLPPAAQVPGAVRDALLAQGVPASRHVVIVENAASAQVRVLVASVGTLPSVASGVGEGPALVLIGEVYADLAAAQNAAREFFSAQRA